MCPFTYFSFSMSTADGFIIASIRSKIGRKSQGQSANKRFWWHSFLKARCSSTGDSLHGSLLQMRFFKFALVR
jgi:hypothetical protein